MLFMNMMKAWERSGSEGIDCYIQTTDEQDVCFCSINLEANISRGFLS